jgi:hypothetical protein
MTGPHPEAESAETRPISVAELLARNGTIGAPAVTRRRRRRRGDDDSVTVAELTGEIPIIRDEHDDPRGAADVHAQEPPCVDPAADGLPANGGARVAPPAPREARTEEITKTPYWSEPEPRWPKSSSRARRASGPERSEYPRPLRHTSEVDADQPVDLGARGPQSGAEHMSPDPDEDYAGIPVDVMDSEVREAETDIEDSAYVRSYLQASEGTLFGGGQTLADEMARRRSDERHGLESATESPAGGVPTRERFDEATAGAGKSSSKFESVWRGGLSVLQSILAVAFGAGLFVAFDQLWRWNSVVALVLSVLVILGLVVGVRVVRKTEDIASTLIAVAVGALITWGPLVLSLQSG